MWIISYLLNVDKNKFIHTRINKYLLEYYRLKVDFSCWLTHILITSNHTYLIILSAIMIITDNKSKTCFFFFIKKNILGYNKF